MILRSDKLKTKAYTKRIEPIYINLPINIIGTGSSGNSVFIEPINTLIDVGLPYKKYTEEILSNIKYIFLTHCHGDHYNQATINKMLNIYPIIKLCVPTPMMERVKSEKWYENHKARIIEYKPNESLELNKTYTPYIIKNYPTKHGDLINYAYDILIPSYNTHMLYASDLEYTTPTAFDDPNLGLPKNPKEKYNLIMLEANYDDESIRENVKKAQQRIREIYEKIDHISNQEDIEKLEKEIKDWNNFIFRNSSNHRHLEEKEAIDYVLNHLTDEGVFIPLHASRLNGTYIIS